MKVELIELKSRPVLLGACTSCPTLHAKLDEALECARSLEADLKSPIATACSSCEVVTLKNAELESRLNLIYADNDYMCKLMGWLNAREPQLGIMIGEYKKAYGLGLDFGKVGETSGERERCLLILMLENPNRVK